jgi:uncharacterized protein (TIGR04255 family)
MSTNTPWRNPPVQEAIFEIRFPPLKDYALFVGGMAAANKEKFPQSEKLPVADLPSSIVIEGQVIHRFYNEERNLIFQTGHTLISLNVIAYSGFIFFSEEIKNIIELAKKYVDNEKITLLSLRYINKFDNVSDPFAILNLQSPFPNYDVSKSKIIQINHVEKKDATSLMLSTNLAFPVNQSSLILDLTIFSNNQEFFWNTESIVDWANKAHELIYDNFESLVSDIEKEKRK